MQKSVLINVLQSLGYSEKESVVYLASLSAGTVPASKLGQAAGLNRVTTYEVLKKLQEKGIITVSIIKGVKHFKALDPNALLVASENRLEAFKQVLPALTDLSSHKSQQHSVQLFEGLKGVKRAYEDTLTSRTEILGYANSKNIRQHWPSYDDDYVAKRAAKKIFFRGLSPADSMGYEVQAQDSQFYRSTLLIAAHKFSAQKLENEIKIYDGKMLIVSFTPSVFAILTQSETVYETQKQIFEIMWNHLKS